MKRQWTTEELEADFTLHPNELDQIVGSKTEHNLLGAACLLKYSSRIEQALFRDVKKVSSKTNLLIRLANASQKTPSVRTMSTIDIYATIKIRKYNLFLFCYSNFSTIYKFHRGVNYGILTSPTTSIH